VWCRLWCNFPRLTRYISDEAQLSAQIVVRVARIEENEIIGANGKREPANVILELEFPVESNKPINMLNGFISYALHLAVCRESKRGTHVKGAYAKPFPRSRFPPCSVGFLYSSCRT